MNLEFVLSLLPLCIVAIIGLTFITCAIARIKKREHLNSFSQRSVVTPDALYGTVQRVSCPLSVTSPSPGIYRVYMVSYSEGTTLLVTTLTVRPLMTFPDGTQFLGDSMEIVVSDFLSRESIWVHVFIDANELHVVRHTRH